MKGILKNQKGVTLVELLAALAIMGLVMVGITGAFMLGNNLYKTAGADFDKHTAALQLEQSIEQKVKYSSALSIYSAPTDLPSVSQQNAVYFDQTLSNPDVRGLVIKTGGSTTVFMQGFFKGYDCSVNFNKVSNTILRVTITIQKSGDSYTLTKDLRLMNLDVSVGTIGGASTGTLIGFNPYNPPASSSS